MLTLTDTNGLLVHGDELLKTHTEVPSAGRTLSSSLSCYPGVHMATLHYSRDAFSVKNQGIWSSTDL